MKAKKNNSNMCVCMLKDSCLRKFERKNDGLLIFHENLVTTNLIYYSSLKMHDQRLLEVYKEQICNLKKNGRDSNRNIQIYTFLTTFCY